MEEGEAGGESAPLEGGDPQDVVADASEDELVQLASAEEEFDEPFAKVVPQLYTTKESGAGADETESPGTGVQLAQNDREPKRPPPKPGGGNAIGYALSLLNLLRRYIHEPPEAEPEDGIEGEANAENLIDAGSGARLENQEPENADVWRRIQEYRSSTPSGGPDPGRHVAPDWHPFKEKYRAYEIPKDIVPFDKLAENAKKPDRNHYSFAAKDLEKHNKWPGGVYPVPENRRAGTFNRLAAELVDRILNDPDNLVVGARHNRIDIWASNGKFGLRFNQDGSFYSFLDAPTKDE